MWQSQRSNELEWMDQAETIVSLAQYQDALTKLAKVGRWLGGDAVTFKELEYIRHSPQKIIDLGCGGGYFTLQLAKKYPQAEVLGLDIDSRAIAFAKKKQQIQVNNLSFILCESANLAAYLKNCDIMTASLMCHHLTDEALVELIVLARKNVRQAIIFNDLQRHLLAYLGYGCCAPLMFWNRMITHDGLISIKRAFHRADWLRVFNRAGLDPSNYMVRWYFPFRWGVSIQCQ
ncbi:MAG: methyltransferase domain-containing protein [Gammaproteobacteria bacterium]|nr:methyltransferase domain-containing protein [Gammaproteobacteria bacterium]